MKSNNQPRKADLPNSIPEMDLSDCQLLIEAMRLAGQQPRFMKDPEASLRLGWLVGMICRTAGMKEL